MAICLSRDLQKFGQMYNFFPNVYKKKNIYIKKAWNKLQKQLMTAGNRRER